MRKASWPGPQSMGHCSGMDRSALHAATMAAAEISMSRAVVAPDFTVADILMAHVLTSAINHRW